MKIVIGNDHAATDMKFQIMAYLEEKGIEVINVGTDTHESFDYAIAAYKAGKLVADHEADGGILICGTGVGISMAANKVKGIRAACCSDTFSARLTRMHNDANVLCMGERVVGPGLALDLVDEFLSAEFEDGGRHTCRVGKIKDLENRK
jgi:ribose 5-phosphate isomerase B